MKSLFSLASLLFCFSTFVSAQVKFEAGYIIDNNDQRINCLIKNKDWRINPNEIQYKLNETSEVQIGGIEQIKEFAVEQKMKYKRATVDVDISSDKTDQLDFERNANFEKRTLFLKVLVEGEADLYYLETKKLQRYFFQVGEGEIKPLVYKRFKVTNTLVRKNEQYKQQMKNEFICDGEENYDQLYYQRKSLRKAFVRYNECKGYSFTDFDFNTKNLFSFSLKPGLSWTRLDLDNAFTGREFLNFNAKASFRIGLSVEVALPFNNRKWSILAEPTYQSYSILKDDAPFFSSSNQNNAVDYRSIELPLGIRYYFFLNEKTKLFVDGFFVYDFPIKSEVEVGTTLQLTSSFSSYNAAAGIGLEFADRYSVEFRYATPRNTLLNILTYRARFQGVALIFGYEFSKKGS